MGAAEKEEVTITQDCEEKVTVNAEDIELLKAIPSAGDEIELRFKASHDWTITEGVDWLSVEPSRGEAGDMVVTITIAENTTYQARSTEIIISTGALPEKIEVTQTESKDPTALIVIPDAKFKAYLIATNIFTYDQATKKWVDSGVKIDANSDNEISYVEAEAIKYIYMKELGINSLEGIEFMPNLLYIYCNTNDIKLLDVGKNPLLQSLSCMENQIVSLDVTNNPALVKLSCSYNELTSLKLGKNSLLEDLWCIQNKLTSLDVTECTSLDVLYCHRNQIITLDVSNCSPLSKLTAYDMDDTSGNNTLTTLYVSSSQDASSSGWAIPEETEVEVK